MSDDLKEQLANATKVAMLAMQDASELGLILRCISDTATMKDFETLSTEVFKVLEQLGLKAVLQIEICDEVEHFGSHSEPSKMELSLIKRAQEKQRIFSRDDITVFSFEHCSLLIKNMPIDDEEKIGRYRDVLAHLVAGMDSRVKAISVENIIREQSANTVKAIRSIRELSQDTQGHMNQILSTLITDLELAISKIVNCDEDEAYFSEIISRCMDDLDMLSTSEQALEKHFLNIVSGYKKGFEVIGDIKKAGADE